MALGQKYTDDELVSLLKQQDKTAFSYLYDKYSASFYGMILTILNQDEKSAQDILQDAFMEIWKNIAVYDNTKEKLFPWMLRITRSAITKKTGIIQKSMQFVNNRLGIYNKTVH